VTTRLEVRAVGTTFGGIRAVHDVSFTLGAGERLAIIGPNGAGKSTLLDGIAGKTPFTTGCVVLDGAVLPPSRPAQHALAGIGRTFQRVEVFASMTVAEHLLLTLRAAHGSPRLWRDLRRLTRQTKWETEQIHGTLAALGLERDASTVVGTLGLGNCRRVEVARALIAHPKLLLLDEVSSGLSTTESAALVATLSGVAAERHMSVIAIEHDLDVVRAIADRVLVMVQGSVIADGAFDAVMADPLVVAAYLGSTA
jgi:branched-chain amino acid transport system ATP-binding protein